MSGKYEAARASLDPPLALARGDELFRYEIRRLQRLVLSGRTVISSS
jgi:hypothetical protein